MTAREVRKMASGLNATYREYMLTEEQLAKLDIPCGWIYAPITEMADTWYVIDGQHNVKELSAAQSLAL